MAKISTKKKELKAEPQSEADQQFSSIFDALSTSAQDALKPERNVREQENVETKSDASTEALMKQIEALNARIEAAERTNMALTSTVRTEPAPAVVAPGELDLSKLPDPLDDPKGYTKALNELVMSNARKMLESQQAASRQQAEHGASVQQLFEDFAIQYPDLADQSDRVEFIAQKVVQAAQRRGIDPNRYMFANSDRFFRDIEKEYTEVFGKPEDDTEEETVNTKRGAQGDSNDNSRTASLFGGMDSGNKPGKAGASSPGDMIKDIHELQRRSSFF